MVGNACGSVWNSLEDVIVKQDQDLFVIANEIVSGRTVAKPGIPVRGLSGNTAELCWDRVDRGNAEATFCVAIASEDQATF